MHLLFILVLAWGILPAPASANVITAAQSPWPPFINNDTEHPGLAIEIVSAAYKTQGYELKFELIPWLRTLKSVQAERVDVIPALWFTQERSEQFRYSHAYLTNNIIFVKRAGDPFNYSGLHSLEGKKVGIIDSYAYDAAFLAAENFEKISAYRLIVNLKRLISNHIDLALGDEIVAKNTINRSHLLRSQFEFSATPLSTTPLHLAISVHHPNAKRYLEAFNKGLAEIRRNGELKLIEIKYGIH